MSSDIKTQYKSLVKRFSEFELEPEQLIGRLNEIMKLAIESTEERVCPGQGAIEVKVRNLAVARACVNDLLELSDKIRAVANVDEESDIKYELIQSWVDEDGSWEGE